jgi:hypothetical protein
MVEVKQGPEHEMEHLDAETTYDHSNLVLVSRPELS